jgi:hypothetical protein
LISVPKFAIAGIMWLKLAMTYRTSHLWQFWVTAVMGSLLFSGLLLAGWFAERNATRREVDRRVHEDEDVSTE